MTAREQILEYLQSHAGDCRTADIAAACECSQGAVYTALSSLTATGEITRVDTGVYRLTGGTKAPKAETKPAARETKAPTPETPPPMAAREEPTEPAAADDPLEVPVELQMGIWSTGELTLARGEQTILLQPAEVREMVQFLDKVGAVPAP